MDLLIITPSYNQCRMLQNCKRSVADQAIHGGRIHHHVQDGGSMDGTVFYLELESRSDKKSNDTYQFSYISESDEGMYDALNKAYSSVEAEGVVSWLNCDEQYFSGALRRVAGFFEDNPDVDILFGGVLMVDEGGALLACRKPMPMRKLFLQSSYLYNFSCATFFRESIWEKLGGFDTSFKNAGDEDLMRRALGLGAKTAVLDEYLATFTYGENNLSSDPAAIEEHERLKSRNPWLVNVFNVPVNIARLLEKFLRGGYHQKGPLSYEIYVDNLERRTTFAAEKPTCRWPDESRPYLTGHRLRS